jgi:hypothetical protein
MITRILALLCRICPLCLVARRWPKSGWARFMASVERCCSFCRAYRRWHEKTP